MLKTHPPVSNQAIDYQKTVQELEAKVGKIRQDLSAILEERFEAVFYTLQSELPDFTPAQA